MSSPNLAPRWRRVIAQGIDFVLVPLLALALGIVVGAFEHAEDYVGLRPLFSALALGVASYLLLNGLLMRRGQTLGKRLLGLRVTTTQEQPACFGRMFVRALFFPLQYLVFFGVALVVPLVDLAFGLRADRRCLHDLACGTSVEGTT